MKTEQGKELLKSFYQVETFPSNIHNLRVMRAFGTWNAPLWLNKAVSTLNEKDWKNDVKIIRKYINKHKKTL
jgi:hypothetical protein